VGFIQQIIDIIMGLLGLKKAELPASTTPNAVPASAGGGSPAAAAAPAAAAVEEEEDEEEVDDDDDEDDDDDDEPDDIVLETREGARLIQHGDGDVLWSDEHDRETPREQWTDHWGPAGDGPTEETLVQFLYAQQVFDEEAQVDPRNAEKKLQAMGYRDVGDYFRVQLTVAKHFGEHHGPNVGDFAFMGERFTKAFMKANGLKRKAQIDAQMAERPELFAPIAGVSLEQYAKLSAVAASAPDQLEAKLAEHGLDMAAYNEAAAGWGERMQNDTDHVINTVYAEHFQSAGQGQFAGAAQAVAGGMYGNEVQGEAPMPKEKAAEVRGAIQAWSKTGQDVNAMLQQTFNMTAADEATVNGWWMMKLMADAPAFEAYQKLVDQFEAKYAAGAPASPDSDLNF
jgi:hypothetical protein